MGKYSYKNVLTFSQKLHYDKHLTNKNPCEIQTDKIKTLVDIKIHIIYKINKFLCIVFR